ncbi:MAG: LPS export ABC transporter periplasmic protein LptC [Coxiella sp. RIFCSPHIGHO2_12_FULL_44_14]|nr:MAG: LPS export ABC transporter periplasmic protein LptC [Coxiella sp. RIFCSPHIGHO2_12_FULL_44_14]
MIKNIVFSVLLIAVLCWSVVLLLNNRRISPPHKFSLDQRPDAFMINANYDEYNAQGLLQGHLFTPKIIHYPAQNSSTFEKPNIMGYNAERIPWYTSALHGRSRDGSQWIYLWDHVVIHQPDQPHYPKTTIKTHSVIIHPLQSLAETSDHVTIQRPDSTIQGQGMKVDFKKGITTLLSHTQGEYETTEPDSSTH